MFSLTQLFISYLPIDRVKNYVSYYKSNQIFNLSSYLSADKNLIIIAGAFLFFPFVLLIYAFYTCATIRSNRLKRIDVCERFNKDSLRVLKKSEYPNISKRQLRDFKCANAHHICAIVLFTLAGGGVALSLCFLPGSTKVNAKYDPVFVKIETQKQTFYELLSNFSRVFDENFDLGEVTKQNRSYSNFQFKHLNKIVKSYQDFAQNLNQTKRVAPTIDQNAFADFQAAKSYFNTSSSAKSYQDYVELGHKFLLDQEQAALIQSMAVFANQNKNAISGLVSSASSVEFAKNVQALFGADSSVSKFYRFLEADSSAYQLLQSIGVIGAKNCIGANETKCAEELLSSKIGGINYGDLGLYLNRTLSFLNADAKQLIECNSTYFYCVLQQYFRKNQKLLFASVIAISAALIVFQIAIQATNLYSNSKGHLCQINTITVLQPILGVLFGVGFCFLFLFSMAMANSSESLSALYWEPAKIIGSVINKQNQVGGIVNTIQLKTLDSSFWSQKFDQNELALTANTGKSVLEMLNVEQFSTSLGIQINSTDYPFIQETFNLKTLKFAPFSKKKQTLLSALGFGQIEEFFNQTDVVAKYLQNLNPISKLKDFIQEQISLNMKGIRPRNLIFAESELRDLQGYVSKTLRVPIPQNFLNMADFSNINNRNVVYLSTALNVVQQLVYLYLRNTPDPALDAAFHAVNDIVSLVEVLTALEGKPGEISQISLSEAELSAPGGTTFQTYLNGAKSLFNAKNLTTFAAAAAALKAEVICLKQFPIIHVVSANPSFHYAQLSINTLLTGLQAHFESLQLKLIKSLDGWFDLTSDKVTGAAVAFYQTVVDIIQFIQTDLMNLTSDQLYESLKGISAPYSAFLDGITVVLIFLLMYQISMIVFAPFRWKSYELILMNGIKAGKIKSGFTVDQKLQGNVLSAEMYANKFGKTQEAPLLEGEIVMYSAKGYFGGVFKEAVVATDNMNV